MLRPLLTPRRTLALVAAALLVTSFLHSAWVERLTRPPRDVLLAVQSRLSLPVRDYVGLQLRLPAEPPDERTTIEQQRQLNDWLRQQNERLVQELADARQTIARLTKLPPPAQAGNWRVLVARVASWRADPLQETLTLNCGARDGVQPGQAVVDYGTTSYVGQVIEATPVAATVRLVSRPGTLVNVVFRPATPEPLARQVVWHVTAQNDGTFTADLKASDPVQVGDYAHVIDPAAAGLPLEARGFLVGRVESLLPAPEAPTMFRRVVVRPPRDLSRLRQVEVLRPLGNE